MAPMLIITKAIKKKGKSVNFKICEFDKQNNPQQTSNGVLFWIFI